MHQDRAELIERYLANVLGASRKLDVVHLMRIKGVNDYRKQGRDHDEKWKGCWRQSVPEQQAVSDLLAAATCRNIRRGQQAFSAPCKFMVQFQ
jgi:hypothetical protein